MLLGIYGRGQPGLLLAVATGWNCQLLPAGYWILEAPTFHAKFTALGFQNSGKLFFSHSLQIAQVLCWVELIYQFERLLSSLVFLVLAFAAKILGCFSGQRLENYTMFPTLFFRTFSFW